MHNWKKMFIFSWRMHNKKNKNSNLTETANFDYNLNINKTCSFKAKKNITFLKTVGSSQFMYRQSMPLLHITAQYSHHAIKDCVAAYKRHSRQDFLQWIHPVRKTWATQTKTKVTLLHAASTLLLLTLPNTAVHFITENKYNHCQCNTTLHVQRLNRRLLLRQWHATNIKTDQQFLVLTIYLLLCIASYLKIVQINGMLDKFPVAAGWISTLQNKHLTSP